MSGVLQLPPARHTWREFFLRLLGIEPKQKLTPEQRKRLGLLMHLHMERVL